MAARTIVKRLQQNEWHQWVSGLDAFLLDCDGVLWRGDASIPGAKEMVAMLRAQNKRVIFVTNNSTKSRDTYVTKLASQGIPATVDDIVTSASATAAYMKQKGIEGKVYVVGEAGLAQELTSVGYECCGLEDGNVRKVPNPFTIDESFSAVVVGLDRDISYYKLAYATTCLRQIPGCRFVGTNPDSTYPVDGAILPGGGTCVNFVANGAERQPEAVVGKPSQDLLKTILAKYNLSPERTCMVGDRLSTDIEFGRRGGLQTLLVLTGVTAESELSSITIPEQIPSYYVQSVDVLNQLQQAHEASQQ